MLLVWRRTRPRPASGFPSPTWHGWMRSPRAQPGQETVTPSRPPASAVASQREQAYDRDVARVTAWVTLADVGTAVGTLVLAGATFISVRASAHSTRIAERALLAGQRPLLAPAGPDHPPPPGHRPPRPL